MPGMRIGAIVNAVGGTIQLGGLAAERERLSAALAKCDFAAEVIFSTGADLRENAERLLEEVTAKRVDAVVVGGGDGSVSTVAGILAGTGVPLGILPLGTLNHFAKDLGLPLDLDGAAQVIAAARTRSVDVAKVNGRVFVNNSSIGIYPYMVVDRERRSAEGHGKRLAMARAFLRMLWRFPRRRLWISAEGWTARYRTPCLFIGNNEYSGDLLTLGERHRLDAGELWLFMAKQQSAGALLWFAFRAAFGGLDQAGDFETRRVGTTEVRMRASRVHVSVDGEVETMRPPLRYRVRPGALRVFAPAASGS
jgi:diacylglycerol kinase family enzyme